MKRIAAIDVGSNAVRMIVGEITPSGGLNSIKSLRIPVRLGRDAFAEGFLTDPTYAKLLIAFKKFQRIIQKEKITEVMAVATSAMRESSNRRAIIKEICEATGIHICIIDGIKEAQLIHAAVARKLEFPRGFSALIDIGGGSLEISILNNGKLVGCETFPLGTVRILTATGVVNSQSDLKKINSLLRKKEREVRGFIHKYTGGKSIAITSGTGGNIEAMGKLIVRLLGGSSNRFFSLDSLDQLVGTLSNYTFDERVNILGLKIDRADVIIPAALTLKFALSLLGASDIFVPGVGLKEGVLITLAKKFRTDSNRKVCECRSSKTKHSIGSHPFKKKIGFRAKFF